MLGDRLPPRSLVSGLLALGLLVGLASTAAAQTSPELWTLREQVRARIAQLDGGLVAVSLIDLADGLELHVDADTTMHAASTMKVPVLLELYRRADEEPGLLDRKILLRNSFRSIADTSHYALDPEDDSDDAVYDRVGDSVTLRYLGRRMIVRSSNLATNALIEYLTPQAIRETVERTGADGMNVRRGVEDIPAYRRGLNNTTTARGLARSLAAIARCTVTSEEACREMLDVLRAQEHNDMIPAGLPPGTPIAHKTGWITGIQHDGAIVFLPNRPPWVLVVLTRGIEDRDAAARTGADIARLAWEALAHGETAPPDSAGRSLAELQRRYRVDAIRTRRFDHDRYWSAVAPYLDDPLAVEELGESAEGRAIRLVRYGHGPRSVLLWSQMHGDESTATMALADLIHYLHDAEDDRTARWAEQMTILMVPMLNPDGAQSFTRHNAYGIDVNRDARALATPEGRILKGLRDTYRPDFGFNLHDQNPRTRVGETDRTVAIALLAPATDTTRQVDATRLRARQVAARVLAAVEPFVGERVARYDDTFNPRAFGDLMQRWGTSTVLIESGGWRGDPEKQYLRQVNFVALASALDAIGSGDYETSDLAAYDSLPFNGDRAVDGLVRGGTVVVPGFEPLRADVSFLVGEEDGEPEARIVEIGDLDGVVARDTVDATGLYVHPAPEALRPAPVEGDPPRLETGEIPSFRITRDAAGEEEVYRIERGRIVRP